MEPINRKSTSNLAKDILTPANLITITRILASPILFILILSADSDGGASWGAFVLGLIFGISDAFDGLIARATGSVTKLGAFLDPLADKVVVLGCMLSLLSIGKFHWIPVVLIFVREFGISTYRFWVVRKGVVIPATNLAKWKTFAQGTTLLVAVLPPVADINWLVNTMLWFAVAMTLISGWQYIRTGNEVSQVGKDK
ncbi:MAG: CDP-diacylglycerol--glycerol-3-phosphate 3-phosphatidyltransferase [Acidimicrobiaceae bacterium]|nr:CDP-diacylglycerol--glycerol-3-phosphate 3-phosphatidyltransferase [Acidimicrobiaceae bacterium]|tara:strand:+ start:1531 stop:2124 length:594 start_codon:yes stop_codon:yes gene_type:complete